MEKLQLKQGCPLLMEGRLPQEIAVYNLLDSLQISYEQTDHPAADTMEVCEAIDRLLSPAVICKNLFLCNAQKTQFYLLMLHSSKKFKARNVARQINCSHLSFASEEYMQAYLQISPGAVSVMGLMHDSKNHVQLLIDQDVLQYELLGCHPCVNTSSMRLHMADLLEKFLPAVHHNYIAMEV